MVAPDADGAEVLIRGAGPVGCALAVALHDSGLRVMVHERQAAGPATPFRPIALSYASRLILERLGAWDRLDATPIETVQVSQQQGFGRTRMDAADAGVPALGYVVDYSALANALRERLRSCGIAPSNADVPALCTVHAEGASDDMEEKRYPQDALVGLVRMAVTAGKAAFERFTAQGPLALLPYSGAYAMVWSMAPARAGMLARVSDDAFLEALSAAAGPRIGTPVAVSSRSVHPLALRTRAARREVDVARRALYIGNAAHTLHPVAGQGLNLGLRDAWDLAQILRGVKDPGEPAVLARYASQRRLDAFATVRATDLLAGAFTNPGRIGRPLRGLALTLLDILPGPRRFFARRMIYGPSALP
jgi:2-octaprenyl-6-methoxyphenol hydroxylase